MNDLIKQESLNPIITRAGDINALHFKTIDEKAIKEISEWMPVVNQKCKAFHKKNSQTTSSLMSLNMIDAGPYRVLRQILAQVERKRLALKENVYRLEKLKLRYNFLKEKYKQTDREELKMKKIACDIVDAQGPIESALKELGALKRRYEEVCKNKKVKENWDEVDFEQAEIKHHICSMFRNAIRDRMQGSHNMGTQEYFEQYGINPITAYYLVDNYIAQVRNSLKDGLVSVEAHYEFYDQMYDLFKDEYKRAMKRIGLDSITHADFLMKEGE